MKKIILILTIISTLLLAGCTYDILPDDEENKHWTWNLKSGWNEITFTQEQIDACRSDAPKDIFNSILTTDNEIAVYQEQDKLRVWSTELPDQFCDLQHIWPNVVCDIHCTSACTLTI